MTSLKFALVSVGRAGGVGSGGCERLLSLLMLPLLSLLLLLSLLMLLLMPQPPLLFLRKRRLLGSLLSWRWYRARRAESRSPPKGW